MHRVCALVLDRFLTRPPFRLAQTTGLQSLNHTQGFFSRTANVQIVDDLVTQRPFRIDHEQTAQRNAALFDEHAVVARHLFRNVRAEREFQTLDAALVPRGLQPRTMRKRRVGRDANYFGAYAFEIRVAIAERG